MNAPLNHNTGPAAIHVRGVTKLYDGVEALKDVTFDVNPGELFGLIGPDGAGKSTLFRILVTVVLPDKGSVVVDGLDIKEDYRLLRQRIGYMPGKFSLYPDLTVRENLEFFASVFGTTVGAAYALIAPIYSQIEPFSDRRAGALSGGMKQKLALSCALVHKPRVLILDEPTTGVDAVSRREFWDMLAALKAGGITTVVATPYMDEATRCDRIALIQDGKLLGAPDTPVGIAEGFNMPLIRVMATGSRPQLLAALRGCNEVARADVFGTWIHVVGKNQKGMRMDEEHLIRSVRGALANNGWSEAVVEIATPSVEDVFMTLVS